MVEKAAQPACVMTAHVDAITHGVTGVTGPFDIGDRGDDFIAHTRVSRHFYAS
jgi:hypothetical protein